MLFLVELILVVIVFVVLDLFISAELKLLRKRRMLVSVSVLALRLLLLLLLVRRLIHHRRHLVIKAMVKNVCALDLVELVVVALDDESIADSHIVNSVVVANDD